MALAGLAYGWREATFSAGLTTAVRGRAPDFDRMIRGHAGEALGGVGPGVSPKTALAVGLKVDAIEAEA